ncbi:MAG: T9SS type A sorting domain-containing protein, partial [Sphingobacteriales bacterium]
ARIAGAGTLATAMNYQCMDSNPAEGANYYRLSQINNSGVTKYLETRKVLYNPPKEFSATVIANGNGKVAINVRNAMPGKVRMTIFDMMGNVVQDRNISISASSAMITARLYNGAYVLLLANANGQTFTSKMIVAD